VKHLAISFLRWRPSDQSGRKRSSQQGRIIRGPERVRQRVPKLKRIPVAVAVGATALAGFGWVAASGLFSHLPTASWQEVQRWADKGELQELIVRIQSREFVALRSDGRSVKVVPYSDDSNGRRVFFGELRRKDVRVLQDLTATNSTRIRWFSLLVTLSVTAKSTAGLDIWLHWREGLLSSESAHRWWWAVVLMPFGSVFWFVSRP